MGNLTLVGQRPELQFRIGFYYGIAKDLVELLGKFCARCALQLRSQSANLRLQRALGVTGLVEFLFGLRIQRPSLHPIPPPSELVSFSQRLGLLLGSRNDRK